MNLDIHTSATTPQLADLPFRAMIFSKEGEDPALWCENSGIHFQMVAADPPGKCLPWTADEFRFASEEDLLKVRDQFYAERAWLETAEGRHLPLASIPPYSHEPDRFQRGRRHPLRNVSAGSAPNRSLSWKHRARMEREARRAIERMVEIWYRKPPAYELTTVSKWNEGPYLLLEIFGHRFLIFVQMIFRGVACDWTAIPGCLVAAAEVHRAKPAVVFVKPNNMHPPTAGFMALEARIKRLPGWRSYLLHGREPSDFLKMGGARLCRVEFQADVKCYEDFWHRPKRLVGCEMLVDGERINGLSLSASTLLRTLAYPNQGYLLNCSCGSDGCAGIKFGCITCEQDGIMLIKMYSATPRRVLLCDALQYRESAMNCLRQLASLGPLPGTDTEWTLVYPTSLKTLARELEISLTDEQ